MKRRVHARRPLPPEQAAWLVSDELWALVEPLLPPAQQRMGRRRLPNRQALQGILYVLHTGIPWQQLPTQLGFGSGFTCWRRLGEWQRDNVWPRLHELLLEQLAAPGEFEWSRAEVPATQIKAGAKRPRRARARFAEGSPPS